MSATRRDTRNTQNSVNFSVPFFPPFLFPLIPHAPSLSSLVVVAAINPVSKIHLGSLGKRCKLPSRSREPDRPANRFGAFYAYIFIFYDWFWLYFVND